MQRHITSVVSGLSIALLPLLAFAQNAANPQQGLFGLVIFFNSFLNAVIVLLITAAIAAFFYFIVKFVLSAGSPEKRKEGMTGIMYSIIAIAIMVSIWGLIKFLQSTFGISNSSAAQAPSVLNIK